MVGTFKKNQGAQRSIRGRRGGGATNGDLREKVRRD